MAQTSSQVCWLTDGKAQISGAPADLFGAHPTATLRLGDQSTPVADDHGVEVVDGCVHVHGAHAVDDAER